MSHSTLQEVVQNLLAIFEKYKYAIKQKMSSFATKSHHFSPDYGQNPVEWLNYLTKKEIYTESNVKKSHKTVPIIICFKKLKERSLRYYRNAIKAIYGEGPYFVCPAYEHLKFTERKIYRGECSLTHQIQRYF